MAAGRFLHVSEEETNKMKKYGVAMIITWVVVLKQLFSSCSAGHWRIIELFDDINCKIHCLIVSHMQVSIAVTRESAEFCHYMTLSFVNPPKYQY